MLPRIKFPPCIHDIPNFCFILANRKLDRTSVKNSSWNNNKDVVPKNDKGKIENNKYEEISRDAKSRNTHTKEKRKLLHLASENMYSKISKQILKKKYLCNLCKK